jgi:hypothetical protein
MAFEKLILRPVDLSGSGITSFQYSYIHPKRQKQINLLVSGEIYEGPLYGGNVRREEKRRGFTAQDSEYVLEYDPKDERSQSTVEAEFILSHPNVFNSSTEKQHENYSGKTNWIITLEQRGTEEDFSLVTKRSAAVVKLISLGAEKWRLCAFRFGINPGKLTPLQVANALCSFSTSPILATAESIEEFVEWTETESGESIRLVAEKAIALGVLTLSGSVYRLGNSPVGSTSDEIVNHFKQDNDSLSQVKIMLKSADTSAAAYTLACKEQKLSDTKKVFETLVNSVKLSISSEPTKPAQEEEEGKGKKEGTVTGKTQPGPTVPSSGKKAVTVSA